MPDFTVNTLHLQVDHFHSMLHLHWLEMDTGPSLRKGRPVYSIRIMVKFSQSSPVSAMILFRLLPPIPTNLALLEIGTVSLSRTGAFSFFSSLGCLSVSFMMLMMRLLATVIPQRNLSRTMNHAKSVSLQETFTRVVAVHMEKSAKRTRLQRISLHCQSRGSEGEKIHN